MEITAKYCILFTFLASYVIAFYGNTTGLDLCLSQPCIHGNCTNLSNSYMCICPWEYTGVNCEIHRCSGSGDWLLNDNQCYSFMSNLTSWDSARTACHQSSADLVSVINPSIQTFLENHIFGKNYWIGLNDKKREGVFVWLDSNITGSFFNWQTGDPDDFHGLEDCVHLLGSGKWNDMNCLAELPYICQKSLDANECLRRPCVHGFCIDLYNGYKCICQSGFTGSNCEIDIDECQSSPCIHGNCSNFVNEFQCKCDLGYVGTQCEIDVNECQSSPCVHGQCGDRVNSVICDCDFGYEGPTCAELKYELLWFLLLSVPISLVILALFIIERAKRKKFKQDNFSIFVFPEVLQGESKPKIMLENKLYNF